MLLLPHQFPANRYKAIFSILTACGLLSLCFFACRPPAPEFIPLPTKICVRTYHHHQPIPEARVYIKYNTETFPGYDKPPSFYDDSFKTGRNARACIEPVQQGTHWLVAFGYDSLYYPHDVFGSLKVSIALDGTAIIDTILYVSE